MQKSCTFRNKKCSFHGGDREIWTLAPISRPTPLAGEPLHQLGYVSMSRYWVVRGVILDRTLRAQSRDWRNGWDSNPRALSDKRFSRPPRYDHFDTSPYLQQWKSAYWTSPVQRTLWYHMYISYVKTLFYILQIFLLFSIIAERIFLLNCFFYFIWYKIPAVSRKNPQYSRCLAQNLSMTLCFYFWRVYLFADKRFCHL